MDKQKILINDMANILEAIDELIARRVMTGNDTFPELHSMWRDIAGLINRARG